jgi:glycosyltransferase involved in cell wall biosynthesis
MIIGVNTRFLLPHKMEGFGWFTYETISRIVLNHPEHQFIFFFDRPFEERFVFAENVTPVVVRPPARHPILFKIWFNISLTRALKKYQCDALISPDGYVSLKTAIPQLSVIHDLNFEHNPEDLPSSALNYLKKYFPKFAHKAARICTVSQFSKEDIINCYGVSAEKIDVTYNGASLSFTPLTEQQKADIRFIYTNGKPYVIVVGALHKRKNLPRLIRAFARFKSTDTADYQLVIVGESMWRGQKIEIPNEIKDAVQFTGHLKISELADLTAAADLLAFVSYFEGFGIPLLEAMQAGTPVLAGNLTALPEIGGDAVWYCNPLDEDDIAKELHFILNSPEKRADLVQKGLERAKLFSWDKTAEEVWKSFERMMNTIK